MHLCKLTIILSWLIAGLSLSVSAQLLDSLLLYRQNNLQEYTQFKNNMTERTWINLIDLNELAGRVINTDNELIWNHLEEEMARNKEIITRNFQ